MNLKSFGTKLNSVEFLVRYHGVATSVWVILAVPSALWWHNSVMWVVFMSLYANIATEWGAWQAARAERRVKDMQVKKP